MNGLDFRTTSYTAASEEFLENLFSVRKKIFLDRLNWNVISRNNLEFDEYDNCHATYIVAYFKGVPLAGTRLINTQHPYMVEGPFNKFFKFPAIKDALVAESSRFFVDSTQARSLGVSNIPITELLLLSMHDYARLAGLTSIVTVVSKSMERILCFSGWKCSVLATGQASPGEGVVLLNMPIDEQNRKRLLVRVARRTRVAFLELGTLRTSPQMC